MQPDFHRLLVDETPDALIVVSPEGKVLYWNRSAETMFGYTSEEATGHALFDLILPPGQSEDGEAIAHRLSATTVTTYESLRRKKDGTLLYINASVRPVHTTPGQLAYWVANIKDVTHLKVLRDAKWLEERYRDLLEPTPDAIVIINDTGRIVLMNSQAERVFGYTRTALIGKPVEVLLPPQLHQLHLEHRSRYLTQPRTRAMGEGLELFGVHQDGHEFPVEVSLTPLNTDTGMMVMSAIHNTSERNRLETTRSLLAAIVESSDDAIVSMTLDGLITSWNRGAEKMFGYTAAEMIGQPVTHLLPADIADEESDILARIHHNARVEHYETVCLRQDGQRLDIELTVSPLKDSTGNIIGVSKIARDITERKYLEHVLQEKQLLEQANQAKDQFLASMSHALRTPLNAILGFTGTLLMQLPGPLNTQQQQQLRTIQSSARHLLSLINDLLDLAKLESGEIELRLQPVVCQQVIAEIATELRPWAHGKGLTFDVHVPTTEVVALTDQRALGQILLHLTHNAIKFTEHGSVQIELSQHQNGAQTVTEISVVDTGIGIRSAERDRLFQAFVRVGPSAKRRDEGTGLGLYLSQKLAELLDGRIILQSELGSGSRFTLVLGER